MCINEELLTKLEKLCNEATEGPWKHDVRVGSAAVYPAKYDINCFSDDEHIVCKFQGQYLNDRWNMTDQQIADAAFISAAREALPLLIAEVRRLQPYAPVGQEYDWVNGDD